MHCVSLTCVCHTTASDLFPVLLILSTSRLFSTGKIWCQQWCLCLDNCVCTSYQFRHQSFPVYVDDCQESTGRSSYSYSFQPIIYRISTISASMSIFNICYSYSILERVFFFAHIRPLSICLFQSFQKYLIGLWDFQTIQCQYQPFNDWKVIYSTVFIVCLTSAKVSFCIS